MASDIFVSGSEFEGMPLGPIEALGAGIKVFLSDIPGHAALLGKAEKFSLSDKPSGAKALRKLVDTIDSCFEETRSNAWEQGREVRERFGIDEMTAEYERHYRILLEK